jgi:hypothetical protein
MNSKRFLPFADAAKVCCNIVPDDCARCESVPNFLLKIFTHTVCKTIHADKFYFQQKNDKENAV